MVPVREKGANQGTEDLEDVMAVTRETLKRMIEELDLIPMSDDELDLILLDVQDVIDGLERVKNLDFSEIRTFDFRADPGRTE
jgi:hypothetical protein